MVHNFNKAYNKKHLRNISDNLLVKTAHSFEHLQMFTPVTKLVLDFNLICNFNTHCKMLPFTARLHVTLICAFTKI